MTKRRKRIITTLAIMAAVFFIIYLNKNPIIRYCYRHRYFAGAFNKVGMISGHQTRTLNFDFSLRDMEFFNSFPFAPGTRQTVDLNFEGENYSVSLRPFNNYFKKIKPAPGKTAFSIRFPPGKQMVDKCQQLNLFQIKGLDFFEQELIYDLGRRLNLYIPKTRYVNVYINYTDYGDYSCKQAYDNIFLEQNNIPESIIFMMGASGDGKWTLNYLYHESRSQLIEKHLHRFFALLNSGDANLPVKYFDLDYIARFEALRKLLEAKAGFVIGDNLKYIYNKTNGKIYPILDESNIFNMHAGGGKKSRRFRLLRKQIVAHPAIKQKRNEYLFKLGKQETYKAIAANFKELEKKYSGVSNDWLYRVRVQLVAEYFNGHIYRRLKGFNKKYTVKARGSPSTLYSRVKESKTYLDRMLLAPGVFLNMNKHLDMQISGGKIVLAPGNYTLYKTLVVPLGYIFEISAGTTVKLAPKVSIVSYSPVHIPGTAEQPVTIAALEPGAPFNAFSVIGGGKGNGSDEKCLVNHLDFSGGSRAFIDGVKLPGGLNLYNIDVEIKNSKIHHNFGDSGLVIKNSAVLLENNTFYANFSDQSTLDFCRGTVKNNRFFNGGKDLNGDGIALKSSEIYLEHNRFENLRDKGASIGEHSTAVLYDNRFKSCRTGAAARDMGRVLLLDNRFNDNDTAAAAYRKKKTLGGGSIYLLKNTFENNKRLFNIDKYSKRYRLQNLEVEGKKDPPSLFTLFRDIRSGYCYKENKIEEFLIGKTRALIDETDRIIFVDLPSGSPVVQPINFKCGLEKTAVYLTPTAYGIHRPGSGTVKEKRIANHGVYNFREYIYRGRLSFKHDFQVDDYELVVSTDAVGIVEIDTADRYGIYREIKNEPKIPCKIRFISPAGGTSPATSRKYLNRFLAARIEGRGKKWEKWKYGITLEKRIAFEGMKKSKRWVLESSYVEKSLMRSKIAFDLLDRIRQSEAPGRKRIAPGSRFVEVILNGDYYGVYLLLEHVDSKFLELEDFDKNEPYNALLYRAKNENANFSPYNTAPLYQKDYLDFPGGFQPREKDNDPIRGWASGFEQRHPDKEKYGEYWRPITDFSKFVALSSQQEFERRIFDIMDIERYIDLWILIQLSDDSDGLYQNRYIARGKGQDARWYFVPWDKDGVFGRNYKMKKRPYTTRLRTPLFDRCMAMDWFAKAFKTTWRTLVENGIITEETIFKMIDENAGILADAQERNFRRWPADSPQYPDINGFYQEIQYMKDWIRSRIQWLDQEINGNVVPEVGK